ncbi:MAG: arginine--tRNA ligase, partial [Planctomycetota bacterium]
QDATINQHLAAHQDVSGAVLRETAKLHEGDEENLRLWKQFLPYCKDEINRVYDRLEVTFDHVLGESFYHDRLAQTVAELERRGLAQQSDGAVCVFVEGFESPMIVQKRDGAFLYATTDLATLQYRHEHFGVQEILYVVDSRQSEHFQKFFALAEPLGFGHIKLVHVSFGTVLGSDGKPMKTRSGELIGLEGLLDDAVAKASQVVFDPQRLANMTPPMEPAEQQRVSEIIGIAAIKYADLSHDRTSDYRFDTDKMVAMEGNTATYIQYSYARTQSILRRVAQQSGSPMDRTSLVGSLSPECVIVGHPAERALIVRLVQLEEALRLAAENYAPNQLCDYLYETAKAYSVFNERCRVLDNQDPNIALTRQALVFLTGEVLKLGLGLLGISVVDRM